MSQMTQSAATSGAAAVDEPGPNDTPLPPHINPREVRRGLAMGGENGKSRTQVYYERLAEQVEPDLKGTPERLAAYVALHKRALVNDSRLFPVEIEATWDAARGTVVLTGYVAFHENRESMESLLKYLGFDKIDDRIEEVPSASLGGKRFGFVVAPSAITYVSHGEGRVETMTEATMGDPIYLLKEGADDDVLVMTSEGYIGYMKNENLRRVDAAEFARYRSGARVQLLRHLEVDGVEMPTSARLRLADNVTSTGGGFDVELPDGRRLTIPKESATLHADATHPLAENAIAVAETFLGTRYRWGGNSLDGIDCSGLVQTSFKTQGVNYPRDADQQSYVGSLSATRWNRDGMRRGDTIYFLSSRDGRISHTGIYLGDNRYIEATGPVVKYSSFDPASPDYDASRVGRFCFAKRLFY